MENSNSIISVRDIKKSYGNVHALQGVSLDVERGKILGLLGPNGAGKTTLVRVLTTLLVPDSGSATISGIDVLNQPDLVRNHIGLAGQYAAVDETLTGRENLILVGQLYHMNKKEISGLADSLLEQFDLVEAGSRVVKTYSGGMRRRLDLAASLVGEPEVLFLDEPTTGLDPRSRADLWKIIEQLVARGTTVVLTTQYLEEADYLADNIIVIDHGQIIAQGTAAELKAQIGGGVLELKMTNETDTLAAMQVLQSLGEGTPVIEEVTGHILLNVSNGSKTLLNAIRALDTAELHIADIELRKPTLDEVFLSLTGHSGDTTGDQTNE